MSLYSNFTLKEWSPLDMNYPTYNELCNDTKIGNFLASFKDKGWISLEIGYFILGTKWNPYTHETETFNAGEACNLIIKNGEILNPEDIDGFLDILDFESIVNPLPAFDGDELGLYTPKSGKWTSTKSIEEKDFFYATYHCID